MKTVLSIADQLKEKYLLIQWSADDNVHVQKYHEND
jgi:hypothetical protein